MLLWALGGGRFFMLAGAATVPLALGEGRDCTMAACGCMPLGIGSEELNILDDKEAWLIWLGSACEWLRTFVLAPFLIR